MKKYRADMTIDTMVEKPMRADAQTPVMSRLQALVSRIEAQGSVTLQEAAELAFLRKQVKGT